MFKKSNFIHEFISEDKKELFASLQNIDNLVSEVINSVILEIRNYDSKILSGWKREGLQSKVGTYLLHYIIPFWELSKANDVKNISKIAAAELLSFLAWRTFDNCIDGHGVSKISHLSSLSSCMQLIGFVQANFLDAKASDIYAHYKVMAEQSFIEVERPVAFCNIWKRCSIVFYVPECIAKLEKNIIDVFRSYINYTGLAHDMTDIADDISLKIISLPVYWLHDNKDMVAINNFSLKGLYDKAKIEIKPTEKEFELMCIDKRFPMMNFLLAEASKIFQEYK